MTDRSKLLALAEAVEKLESGGSFAVETDIAYALNLPFEGLAKPYTFSLDAAVSLVPMGWGWMQAINPDKPHSSAATVYGMADDEREATAFATTPALALTAASLRAQAEALS